MKKIISCLLLSFLIFSFSSCLKENHKIRFKNNYKEAIYNVKAGSAAFGTVGAAEESDYSAINSGNFSISGNTAAGVPLSGSGSVTGKGRHKWTLTLSSAGQVSITEDK